MHSFACAQVAVVACLLGLSAGAHDLSTSYPFRTTLNTEEEGGLYELYWRFDNEAETISFAVRVQTTGWVGFGLSPNGQMPNSDVVIGWVENNEAFLHDRFATARAIPPIDEQQDWCLVEGEEEDEFTILEFNRNYTTCDDNDLTIQADTARVIWSFHPSDPTSPERLSMHTEWGSTSLNLLGGVVPTAPDPDDLETYDVLVENVEIPSADTTYWCIAVQLPEEIRNQTRYITKYAPVVTEGNEAHVHHLLIYLCDGLNNTHVGASGDCDDGVDESVQECRGGTLIAAWAVGGDVFRYPDNVAFPFGGPGTAEYLVMELHYDNPGMVSGTRDNSGIRFFYTSQQREHDAGILELGHRVEPYMFIPPNTPNYTVGGMCVADCTNRNFPSEGIHIFSNLLHTHVVGHGLTLQHVRYNAECGGYEELEPIDTNLRYDFNYQQFTQLPRIRTVLPGDIVVLKCFYDTKGLKNVTLGGLGTRDEMCLSFPVYYPRVPMSLCLSTAQEEEVYQYAITNLPNDALSLLGQGKTREGLDAVDWDSTMVQTLQDTLLSANQTAYCIADTGNYGTVEKFPEIKCPYIPPDTCTGYTPTQCPKRLEEGSAVTPLASVAALLLTILALLM